MSASALDRAAAYVDARGDALARARAAVLTRRASPAAVIEQLDAEEHSPNALRAALEICDDLRALDAEPVAGWVRALCALQSEDGGWGDAALEQRLFESGMIAGHLAKTRGARPEVLDAAAEWLASHWNPDRVQGGSWCAIAAYAHLFANVDHEESDAILQWCGRELGRAFQTKAFDALRTARVLVYCDAHGLPGSELEPGRLLAALLAEQQPDGSFAAWPGEGARDPLASTLDALVALRRLG